MMAPHPARRDGAARQELYSVLHHYISTVPLVASTAQTSGADH